MSSQGWVYRFGMQSPAVRAALALVALISPMALAYAQAIVPALKSDWIYYEAYAIPQTATACSTTDLVAAEAMIDRMSASSAHCNFEFSRWTTAWPNTEGRTDWRQLCPAPGIPITWGYQHKEVRGYEYSYQASCVTPSKSTHSIERHFFYYCADSENYELFQPPYGSGPLIPACKLKSGKPDPAKQPRTCCSKDGNPSEGDPIDVGTGNTFDRQLDYRGAGSTPLLFERHYNSNGGGDGSIGANWRHTYSRRIDRIDLTVATSVALVRRPDGRVLTFNNRSGAWQAQADIAAVLNRTSNPSGWTYKDEDDSVETFDNDGRLQSITTRSGATTSLTYDTNGALATVADADGRQLSFAYGGSGRISVLTTPGGGTYQYGYDSAGNLTTVTAADLSVRTYLYGESAHAGGGGPAYAHTLTGIVDESNHRYATWQYDAQGRGIRSEHASGVGRVDVVYNADGTVTVTDALGATRTHILTTTAQGVRKIASISGHLCRDCGQAASYVYDTNGLLNDWRDARNTLFQRRYTSDGRNLPTSEWKASGSGVTQSTAYVWHPTFRLPTQITEGNRRTEMTHDAFGNVSTRTVKDIGVSPNVVRAWTYTYNGLGRVLTEDGPRTDVTDLTTYSYYNCTTGHQCGQLQSVTNAAGHTTTYNTYNADGQPLTITDANGVVTTLTYDLRQRLTSRGVGTEVTSFEYWPTGPLKKVTLPDGSHLDYLYDVAHRLTDINDAEGNRVHYTLDAMGNHTSEQIVDPSNVLIRTRTRVFNTLNLLYQEIGAAGTVDVTTTYGYDANGNPTSIVAPLGRDAVQVFDELNRLKQVTDPLNGVTKYGYNTLDQLISVTDPRNLITSYSYNALGDLRQLTSPDTGITINTYDSGGNLATSTDARSAVATYGYDELNRVATTSFSSGSTTDPTLTYTYDAGTYGKGRLTGVSDSNHSLSWTYDEQGRVLTANQSVGSISKTTSYAYANGLRQSMTTPSGQVITYGYTNGKITSVSVNGTVVVSNILYDPFGPVRQWTWADGSLSVRTFDQDGKVTQIDSAGLKTYGYDNAFRITGITDTTNSASSWTYGYDDLDRLTSASKTGTTHGYTYDANGNRLTETGSSPSTFTVAANNNRLSSTSGALARTYGYDNAGNTTSFTGVSFTYNSRGRMSSSTKNGVTTSYVYNALGQLIQKSANTLYYYDDAGHILGMYDGSGVLTEEIVWMDDTPIATLRPSVGGGVSIYNIHSDHLNTPRVITDPVTAVVRWRWDGEPFGGGTVNDNPSGGGTFEFKLRFPGQMAFAETGLHYNFFRDYDSATGRYVESDPVGLAGGINTYAYVTNDPARFFDSTGRGKEGGQGNIGGDDPLMPRYNGNTPQAQVDEAIKKAEDALKDKSLKPDRAKRVRGWVKVAKRGFTKAVCPPLIEEIVLGVLGESCRNGDMLACQSYIDLGGEIENGT